MPQKMMKNVETRTAKCKKEHQNVSTYPSTLLHQEHQMCLPIPVPHLLWLQKQGGHQQLLPPLSTPPSSPPPAEAARRGRSSC